MTARTCDETVLGAEPVPVSWYPEGASRCGQAAVAGLDPVRCRNHQPAVTVPVSEVRAGDYLIASHYPGDTRETIGREVRSIQVHDRSDDNTELYGVVFASGQRWDFIPANEQWDIEPRAT